MIHGVEPFRVELRFFRLPLSGLRGAEAGGRGERRAASRGEPEAGEPGDGTVAQSALIGTLGFDQ